MAIPKVVFRYSWIYDQICMEHYKTKSRKYPSSKETMSYIKKIEPLWRMYERKVLKELSRITGLKWKSKNIYCYVVGISRPFSDPLTIPVYKKYPDYFIDVLVHELIHQLFTQDGNIKKSKKAWRYIDNKYSRKHRSIRIHIPLQAIHSHIYLKFFNTKRMQRDVNMAKRYGYYKESWEAVNKEGYQKIIRDFAERIDK